MDPVLEELFGILSTYAVHDVRIPYYGPVTGYLPVTHVVVSAKMRGEFMRQDTPEHWREDALVRVHEMLADLENHLWVRTESPDSASEATSCSPPASRSMGNSPRCPSRQCSPARSAWIWTG